MHCLVVFTGLERGGSRKRGFVYMLIPAHNTKDAANILVIERDQDMIEWSSDEWAMPCHGKQ